MVEILAQCPFIDSIEYGNPSNEDFHNMQKDSYLDMVLPRLRQYTPPKNSSAVARDELNELIGFRKLVTVETRKKIFDSSLVPYIRELYVKNGADPDNVHGLTQSIIDDVVPIITKLKYTFQRPRPYQLARCYQVKLFPDYSYFVSSPSFPSGHTTLAAIICEVLGNHYPESYDVIQRFVEEVSQSRLLLGVHYRSDNNMALLTAREIIGNTEFKMRYKL